MPTGDHDELGQGNNGGVDHYTLLFVSDLAPSAPLDSVAGIARQARTNNARTDITGLLVFDGEHFAQLMEGPQAAVVSVAELMRTDRRHRAMEILYSVPSLKPRRFPSWRLGYLLMDLQEFGVASLRGQQGPAALEAFHFMLPALDMAVGDAVPRLISRPAD